MISEDVLGIIESMPDNDPSGEPINFDHLPKKSAKGSSKRRDLDEAKFVSVDRLASRYDVSKASIWRWVRLRKFPDPVHINSGCTRWKIEDIEKWESKL